MMLLEADELQYIAQAIDTHIRTHGLTVAAKGIAIITKIQAGIQSNDAQQARSGDPPETKQTDKPSK